MTLRADLYWSFRSPYSYLAIGRYRAMTEAYDLEIALKPIYPLAIRQPDFFARNHPNWLGYTIRDVARLSQYLGMPIAPPRPDPIVQDRGTREIAADQPYIFRLVRLGQAAARRGKALEFCHEAANLIWGGTENWQVGDHLANAAERAGLNLRELEAETEADAAALDAEVSATRRRWKRPAIGAYRRSSSWTNPFSGRIGSIWRSGECRAAASRRASSSPAVPPWPRHIR